MGAMSGAGLIAAAVVVFVLLVSALVFEDLPVAGLVGGDDQPSVSANEPAAAGAAVAGATTGPGGAAAARAGAGKGDGAIGGPGDQGAPGAEGGGQQSPGGGGTTTGGGGTGGDSTPAATTGSNGGSGGGATGTASSGGSGGGGGSDGGTTSSTSAKVTGTVNETVDQVDQNVTGGALGETGVTQTTEEVVSGVAGPESVVGKTVDETAKTAEGVVGGLTGK
ncbi:MAG TPA: hypothetical protein VN733_06965 [Solirubrobacterales bacterium]|nr:hypothetical protein [Solirubrobacterales bacterium]